MVNVVHNIDCMIGMAEYPDKYFDLAVVDPPYGINASEFTMGSGKNKKYKKGKFWDIEKPDAKYFIQLTRVSKNQIIWGGNYFILPISKSWIFWDKGIYGDCNFSDGELAWTSFNKVLRIAKIRYKGFLGSDSIRIHPTQKPVKLYDWIFTNYAEPGMKILDTHVGSGSSRIAAHKHKLDFIGYELDEEYWNAQEKRFAQYKSQLTLW
jgi:site-specific DNA-methyltransferase (adenine-specific)